jgi:DNA-binding NtrC family response regulator
MERAPILCGAGRIMPQHMPMEAELTSSIQMDEPEVWQEYEEDDSPTQIVSAPGEGGAPPYERIAEALRRCGGNQTRAARLLGISRRTLVNRLNEYNLPRPRKRVV